MSDTGFPDRVEAHIEGKISGQVAVGNYNAQLNVENGVVVNWMAAADRPAPRLRQAPVLLRPRPISSLLGRASEKATIAHTLDASLAVEIHGPVGMGKSALLRDLAYDVPDTVSGHSVLYFSAKRQPRMDLLQYIFDALYEADVSLKPTEPQLRQYLGNVRALVLLDDVDLPRNELEALLDAAPDCKFAVTTADRHLWDNVEAVALQGLALEPGIALIEKGLGRPLIPDERPRALALCAALDGHPLSIIQATALMREQARAFSGLGDADPVPADLRDRLVRSSLNALSAPSQRVLAVIAAMSGSLISVQHVAAIAGLADAVPALEALEQTGLVHQEGMAYRLSIAPEECHDLTSLVSTSAQRAVDHFAAWAEEHAGDPRRVADEVDAITATMEWGARAGRWPEVLRIARAAEGVLAWARRWGAWGSMLETGLEAARLVGDADAQGWFLHQLGARALCLDDGRADGLLRRALRIREAQGDGRGAAVTRHNLRLVGGLPPPPPPSPRLGPRHGRPAPPRRPVLARPKVMAAGVGGVALLLGGVIAGDLVRWLMPPLITNPPPVSERGTPQSSTSSVVDGQSPTQTAGKPQLVPAPTPTVSATPSVSPCAASGCDPAAYDLTGTWKLDRAVGAESQPYSGHYELTFTMTGPGTFHGTSPDPQLGPVEARVWTGMRPATAQSKPILMVLVEFTQEYAGDPASASYPWPYYSVSAGSRSIDIHDPYHPQPTAPETFYGRWRDFEQNGGTFQLVFERR